MDNQSFLNAFNNAHANVCKLIEEKQEKTPLPETFNKSSQLRRYAFIKVR